MSTAEVVQRAEDPQNNPLSECALCNAFEGDGVANMSSSDFLTEVDTKSRNKFISDKIPNNAQALFLPRF